MANVHARIELTKSLLHAVASAEEDPTVQIDALEEIGLNSETPAPTTLRLDRKLLSDDTKSTRILSSYNDTLINISFSHEESLSHASTTTTMLLRGMFSVDSRVEMNSWILNASLVPKAYKF